MIAFQRPKRLACESDSMSATYGKFFAQPFERPGVPVAGAQTPDRVGLLFEQPLEELKGISAFKVKVAAHQMQLPLSKRHRRSHTKGSAATKE